MGTKQNPGKFDCYEKAEPHEPIFCLLARDSCAPDAVHAWANLYASSKGGHECMNYREREKVTNALKCVTDMHEWRRNNTRTHDIDPIQRIRDAIEGECAGLAINNDQARAILLAINYPGVA